MTPRTTCSPSCRRPRGTVDGPARPTAGHRACCIPSVARWTTRRPPSSSGSPSRFSGLVFRGGEEASAEVARLVPPDRLLVETDSPYLKPRGVRGSRNEPRHVAVTAAWLRELRGDEPEAFGRRSWQPSTVSRASPARSSGTSDEEPEPRDRSAERGQPRPRVPPDDGGQPVGRGLESSRIARHEPCGWRCSARARSITPDPHVAGSASPDRRLGLASQSSNVGPSGGAETAREHSAAVMRSRM